MKLPRLLNFDCKSVLKFGVVPAVARYYENFVPGATQEGLRRYFLAAAVLKMLYKRNASIPGAEGKMPRGRGVAWSRAAAELAAALNATNHQIECAA